MKPRDCMTLCEIGKKNLGLEQLSPMGLHGQPAYTSKSMIQVNALTAATLDCATSVKGEGYRSVAVNTLEQSPALCNAWL